MDDPLDFEVRRRANHACEYCRLPQSVSRLRFHIEHVVAQQHGGLTESSNLALACPRCNLHKGPNLSGIDPVTGKKVWLFNPRRQQWKRHFRWHGPILDGRTPAGRATTSVSEINDPQAVEVREALIEEGVFPPEEAPRGS